MGNTKLTTKQPTTNDHDSLVKQLIGVVQQKKAEIADAEKPSWKTNCSFAFSERGSDRINLQTVAEVTTLVDILSQLMVRKEFFEKAVQELKAPKQTTFKWMGFSFEDWKSDLQTRVNKIQIKQKKDELAMIEAQLNELVSPEEKKRLLLESLQQSLASMN